VEVLVVGLDGPGLVQEDNLVRLISTGQPVNPAVARNIGIREARGEIICFTDADCLPDRDWLKRLTGAFNDDDVSVVGGGVAFAADNYWTWCDNLSWFHEFLTTTPEGPRDILPSLNLAVHREVIEQVGGFDERYPRAAGEDADWTVRMRQAGFNLHFIPQAIVTHHPARTTFADMWRHGLIYGQFSTKINPKYNTLLKPPILLKRWWLLILSAPALALWGTLKILLNTTRIKKTWLTFPGIFAGKIAWCVGAAATLRQIG
jgi:GT2 family glycosyltransferase